MENEKFTLLFCALRLSKYACRSDWLKLHRPFLYFLAQGYFRVNISKVFGAY